MPLLPGWVCILVLNNIDQYVWQLLYFLLSLPIVLLSIILELHAPNGFFNFFFFLQKEKKNLYRKNFGQESKALLPILINEHNQKLKQTIFNTLNILSFSQFVGKLHSPVCFSFFLVWCGEEGGYFLDKIHYFCTCDFFILPLWDLSLYFKVFSLEHKP